MGEMDVSRTALQARALASTPRILAVMRLELLEDEEALTEQDRDLLKGAMRSNSRRICVSSLGGTKRWGTEPEAALAEMRGRIRGGSHG